MGLGFETTLHTGHGHGDRIRSLIEVPQEYYFIAQVAQNRSSREEVWVVSKPKVLAFYRIPG